MPGLVKRSLAGDQIPYTSPPRAGMAELVDAVDSKSTGGNPVQVRFLFPAPSLSLLL